MVENRNRDGEGGRRRDGRVFLVGSFQILCLVLQSLLLPISFLLLVRLSSPTEYLTFPLLTTVLLLLLQMIIPTICFSTLLHVTMSYIPNLNLYSSWATLIVLHVTVVVGIESTITTGVSPSVHNHTYTYSSEETLVQIQRICFFVGVYETMLLWSRVLVRPVVNDTLYGSGKEETAVERNAVRFGFGLVWWFMIRQEVEDILRIGRLDGVLCWIVGMTTTLTGLIRIVRGIVWAGNQILRWILFSKREDKSNSEAVDLVIIYIA